jgi:uncharacterized protein YoxC
VIQINYVGGIGVRLLFNNKNSTDKTSLIEGYVDLPDSGLIRDKEEPSEETSSEETSENTREHGISLESVEYSLLELKKATSAQYEDIKKSLNQIQTELIEYSTNSNTKPTRLESGLLESDQETLGYSSLRNEENSAKFMSSDNAKSPRFDPGELAEKMLKMSLDSKNRAFNEIKRQLESEIVSVRKGILALLRAEEVLKESNHHEGNFGSPSTQDKQGTPYAARQKRTENPDEESLKDIVGTLIEEDKRENRAFRERMNELADEVNQLMAEVDEEEREVENLKHVITTLAEEEMDNSVIPEHTNELTEEANQLMAEVDKEKGEEENLKHVIATLAEEEMDNSVFPEYTDELTDEVNQLLEEVDEEEREKENLEHVIATLAETEKRENNAFLERINKLMEEVYEEEAGKLSRRAN